MAKKKTAAPKTVYAKEDAERLAERLLPSFQIQNHMYLSSGTAESAKRRNIPSVSMFHDEQQYFDPKANAIHLGSHGPLEYFKVETEEDYVSGMEFLFGHENQHVRSTATTPYQKGITRCVQVIIEYMAKKEGISKRFRNERDYEVFLNTDLRAKGVYVSMNTLISLCAHLMNSIEDGRIERIRSLEFPGFALQRAYFRGLEWTIGDNEYVPYGKMKPQDHLELIFAVVHSLATKNLYPKGYVMAYYNTPIIKEVVELMPFIASAVLAGKTRKMADNVVKIVEKLSPLIYEAVKMDANQADAMMQQMLSQLLAKMFAAVLDPNNMSQLSEREEGEASEQECPAIPGMSDLVVTLPDEVYDKLMEQKKQSDGNGQGIMVRREHPKEEEKKDENSDGKGSGSGSGKKSESDEKKSNSGSGSGGGEKKDDEANSSSSSGEKGENTENKSGEGPDGNPSNNGEGSANDGNRSQSGEPSNPGKSSSFREYDGTRVKNEGESAGMNNSEESNGSRGSGLSDGSLDEVREAMKNAAEQCRSEAAETVSTINKATVSANKTTCPVIPNVDKQITPEEVKDICRNFSEVKRKYKLDQPLPPVLNTRAKAFRKKNERYFKSLSTPNITNLSSGGVDPSLIYGLTFGETNVFRKIGQDKKFNGCVYVLIDNSGSMSGNKRKEACKAAAVIEDGFKGLIPMKIVAFDYSGSVIHEVVKGWNESQKLNCCWNFACHGRNGCGNDDARDILIAQRELLARPEEKKLLIVLSDGAPADTDATRKAISDTRKKGINVFGIYFEEGRVGSDADEFRSMYQKDYVCCPLDEVDANLTKLMIKFSRS